MPELWSVAATDSRNSGERWASTNGRASPSTLGVDAPHRFASQQLGAEVGDRVGDERAREHRLDLAVLGVVEHHLGALDRAGGVGEVVAEHLVLVELGDGDAAVDGGGACEVVGGGGDDLGRAVDRGRRRRELVGHGRQPTDGAPAITSGSSVARRVGGAVVGGGGAVVGGGAVTGGDVTGGDAVGAGAGGVVAMVPPPPTTVFEPDARRRPRARRDLGAALALDRRLGDPRDLLLGHAALRVDELYTVRAR